MHTHSYPAARGNGGGGGPGSARAARQGHCRAASLGALLARAPRMQTPCRRLVSLKSGRCGRLRGGHGKLPWRAERQGCGQGTLDLSRARHTSIHPGQTPCPPRAGSDGPVLGDPVGRAGGRTGERRPPKAPALDTRAPSVRLGWNPRGWCPPARR